MKLKEMMKSSEKVIKSTRKSTTLSCSLTGSELIEIKSFCEEHNLIMSKFVKVIALNAIRDHKKSSKK